MKQTLEEKLNIFKENGWTYNSYTGDIYSHTGKIIKGRNKNGYIQCNISINKTMISIGADKDITYIKGELKYKEYLMEFLQEMREQKLNEILK